MNPICHMQRQNPKPQKLSRGLRLYRVFMVAAAYGLNDREIILP